MKPRTSEQEDTDQEEEKKENDLLQPSAEEEGCSKFGFSNTTI